MTEIENELCRLDEQIAKHAASPCPVVHVRIHGSGPCGAF